MVQILKDFKDGTRSDPTTDIPTNSQSSDTEQDIWRQFAEATTPKAFCQSWLSLQCYILKGIRSALVLLGTPDRGPFTPAAIWPHPNFNVTHLAPVAERVSKERRVLLIKSDPNQYPDNVASKSYYIAYPIEVAGKIYGVVVLEVGPHPGIEVQAIMRHLHWGAGWLEVMLRRAEAMKTLDTSERLRAALNLVASIMEHKHFQPAIMAFVTKLATMLDCDRVSLGFKGRQQLRVCAISHSADFRETDESGSCY